MKDKRTKESYRVEGMTCSGYQRTIQRVVGNIEGVKSSKADLKSSSVSVQYDPEEVSADGQREGSDQAKP